MSNDTREETDASLSAEGIAAPQIEAEIAPLEAVQPTVDITARAVVLRTDQHQISLEPETAIWLARSLLRAALRDDGELVAVRDGIIVGAHVVHLASGAPAVVITGPALFALTEAYALVLALALLDARELVEPPPAAPVVLVLSDLSQQARYPA